MKADKKMIQARIQEVIQRCVNRSTSINECCANCYSLSTNNIKTIEDYAKAMRVQLNELIRLNKAYLKAPEYS